jgi:polysaccharide biosynthesis protein PslH
MKVLQLCHKPLFGSPDGGKIAMTAMAKGLLTQKLDVFQWMLASQKHPIPAEIPADYPFKWTSSYINTELSAFQALKTLLKGRSYNISRFEDENYYTPLFDFLKNNTFDIIQAEGIFALSRVAEIRKYSAARIVLRAHNIEFLIWERMADQERNPLKKVYLRILASQLKQEEEAIWKSVDAIIAISQQDADYIKSRGISTPITVIGIATDLSLEETSTVGEIKNLFHLGAMDWRPNREGVEWFIKNIWPEIFSQFPELRFVLAGKHMPEQFKNLADSGVDVAEVDDAYAFYKSMGIMIVPLLSGSGIRVKIIEGMALGKLIISTTLGAEGINARPGNDFFIADDAESFCVIIRQLLSKPNYIKEVSENARTFAHENYRTEVLGARTLDFYREVIKL